MNTPVACIPQFPLKISSCFPHILGKRLLCSGPCWCCGLCEEDFVQSGILIKTRIQKKNSTTCFLSNTRRWTKLLLRLLTCLEIQLLPSTCLYPLTCKLQITMSFSREPSLTCHHHHHHHHHVFLPVPPDPVLTSKNCSQNGYVLQKVQI